MTSSKGSQISCLFSMIIFMIANCLGKPLSKRYSDEHNNIQDNKNYYKNYEPNGALKEKYSDLKIIYDANAGTLYHNDTAIYHKKNTELNKNWPNNNRAVDWYANNEFSTDAWNIVTPYSTTWLLVLFVLGALLVLAIFWCLLRICRMNKCKFGYEPVTLPKLIDEN